MSSPLTKNSIIRILIGIVLIVFIASVLYLFRLKEIPTEKERKGYTVTGEKIPPEVFSYNGIVENIKEGEAQILSTSGSNYIPADTRFVIKVREDTKVFKYYIVTVGGQEGYPRIEQKQVPFKEITVGDTVVVYSKENIKGSDSFEADQLVVLP